MFPARSGAEQEHIWTGGEDDGLRLVQPGMYGWLTGFYTAFFTDGNHTMVVSVLYKIVPRMRS